VLKVWLEVKFSYDADQGQIWNCQQTEGPLGDGIFSLSFVSSMVSMISLLEKYIPFSGFCTIP